MKLGRKSGTVELRGSRWCFGPMGRHYMPQGEISIEDFSAEVMCGSPRLGLLGTSRYNLFRTRDAAPPRLGVLLCLGFIVIWAMFG